MTFNKLALGPPNFVVFLFVQKKGDLEKTHLHLEPIDMMNRDKMSQLPVMQVDFVDQICSPVYKCMSGLSGALDPLAAGCQRNRKEWLREADEQKRRDTRAAVVSRK